MAALMTILLMVALFLIVRHTILQGKEKAESEAEERMRAILSEERLGEVPEATQSEREEAHKPTLMEKLASWLGNSQILREKEGQSFMQKLDTALVQAGVRERYTPEQALALALTIWTLGIGIPALLRIFIDLPVFIFLLAVVVFAAYPPLKLRSLVRERQDSIRADIPFFIGQLRMALSSGMATIDEAIVRVARTAEEDQYESIMAREFAQAQVEYRLGGKDMETALRGVGERTGVTSAQNLVEAMIQGLRTGTEMEQVLLEYMDQAREMWRQDMRIYKNRKQPLVTLGLVITMFGAFIIFAVPMIIELFQTLGGIT